MRTLQIRRAKSGKDIVIKDSAKAEQNGSGPEIGELVSTRSICFDASHLFASLIESKRGAQKRGFPAWRGPGGCRLCQHTSASTLES